MPIGATTKIQFLWRDRAIPKDFRTGVSLHSHTMYSEESLELVPRYTEKVPFLGRTVRREVEELSQRNGFELNFAYAFFTPPLAPRQAYRLEEKQIQRQFQLPAMVSLTDHDDIRAGTLLRVLDRFRDAPVSTEWTVPFETTLFHLGIHNMPANEAPALMQQFHAFTATPRSEMLAEILDKLNSYPEVLIVLNHPLWNEKGISAADHAHALWRFLYRHSQSLHALEVNGLRSSQENRKVLQLGAQIGLPVVAGGDRHCREPNALLNLSRASNFAEFVDEVRNRRFSYIVFMPQYRKPLKMRILQTMIDIVRDYPENVEGRRSWSDRVFYREPGSAAIPVSSIILHPAAPWRWSRAACCWCLRICVRSWHPGTVSQPDNPL